MSDSKNRRSTRDADKNVADATQAITPRLIKRMAWGNALADLALRDGLDALSLRPAAALLGTSDRMLLYYFGTKAELIADTLNIVSARLASKLAASSPPPRLAPVQMIEVAAKLLADPDVRPYMALWAEIVARAIRGDDIYRVVTAQTMAGWIAWIGARTDFPPDADPAVGATAMLAVVEGLSTLGMLGAEIASPGTGLAALLVAVTPAASTSSIIEACRAEIIAPTAHPTE